MEETNETTQESIFAYNLEYNTERNPLIIPEYGRHIQKMVEKAMKITDPIKRNNAAKGIIAVMGNMNPHLRDVPDFQHKLWDQLFKMSNFEIDVEAPFERPTKESTAPNPERLEVPQHRLKYRFYGNNILKMIQVCNSWEEGELKDALKLSIANHMKKCFLAWNKEGIEDSVIFEHLYELSDGKIDLTVAQENLSTNPTHYQKKSSTHSATSKNNSSTGKNNNPTGKNNNLVGKSNNTVGKSNNIAGKNNNVTSKKNNSSNGKNYFQKNKTNKGTES